MMHAPFPFPQLIFYNKSSVSNIGHFENTKLRTSTRQVQDTFCCCVSEKEREEKIMELFKCEMCGAPLEVSDSQSIVECEYCGTKQTVHKHSDSDPLLKRAYMYLEDGEWKLANKYCEKVLDQNPENAEAYLIKLMAKLWRRRKESLQLELCKGTMPHTNR